MIRYAFLFRVSYELRFSWGVMITVDKGFKKKPDFFKKMMTKPQQAIKE